jgi:hypothetical protein
MDFVSDQLFDGRRFRALTLVDNYSRECLEIEVGQNLKGIDVVAVMERIKALRGVVPQRIQCDNVLPAKASRRSGDSLPERGDSRYLPSSCYPSFSSVASIF